MISFDEFINKYSGKTKGYPYYSPKKPYSHSKESREKMSKSHTGKKLSAEHKRKIVKSLIGRKVSQETRKKIANAQKGKKHWNWKGDDVKYRRLHAWVVNECGKANKCEDCNTKTAKAYDWANISGKYLRDVSDYKQLCRSCHIKFDDTPEKKAVRQSNLAIGRKIRHDKY